MTGPRKKRDGPASDDASVLGFGFEPSETEHHFVVSIPHSPREDVLVAEQLVWHPHPERRHLSLALGNAESRMRVILRREKWEAIADALAEEFNTRLRRQGKPGGAWRPGYTEVARLLGKELVLLAWAIEDADPALIPTAIRNWKGLTPEERWWLFTMTNAATGHAVTGRSVGWRKALRFALTESPVPETGYPPVAAPFRLEALPGVTSTETPKKPSRKRPSKT